MSDSLRPSLILPPKFLQNFVITQDCKELMSALPKEKGWISDDMYLYLYQGFWFAPAHLQGTITCQKHFRAYDTDVFLATTPKSGTTWLKALLYAVANRSSLSTSLEEDQAHLLVTKNPHDLVPYLEMNLYVDGQIPDLSSLSLPRLFSTHLPLTSLPNSIINESGCKVIYLCREPKDTFISYWHFINTVRTEEMGKMPLEEALERFCNGTSMYGPFWDHVLGYWKESLEKPQKIMFLKYEDMKDQPRLHVTRLAEFMGCPFSLDEEKDGTVERIIKLCSFDSLSNLGVNKNGTLSTGQESKSFFRKGETGDWMNYLTPEMAHRINHITEEKFQGTGLMF